MTFNWTVWLYLGDGKDASSKLIIFILIIILILIILIIIYQIIHYFAITLLMM